MAVVDIGKTNAKPVLIGADTGRAVETLTIPNRLPGRPPYPHYDIEGLWAFVLESLGDLNRRHAIDGISITTQRGGGAGGGG
jgi:sugar (pentulose or hexulose) kinase